LEKTAMPGKQAKVVTPPMLKRMLRRVSRSSFPARDRTMILLSIKAGLRACEIAGLDWSMVLDGQGHVSGTIHVRDVIAKKRGGRRIPMHPDLRRALEHARIVRGGRSELLSKARNFGENEVGNHLLVELVNVVDRKLLVRPSFAHLGAEAKDPPSDWRAPRSRSGR
jgi:integrase